jgi:single-strand DNA-binding protein
MSFVKLQVLGHIGKDAEINNVNGKSVVNFNLCHTERYKDSNGVENNKSIWISCSYWSDKVNVAQYIKKGGMLFVEGQPFTDTYTKDGKTLSQLKLRVTNIHLIGSGNGGNTQPQQPAQQNNATTENAATTPIDDTNDGLPF